MKIFTYMKQSPNSVLNAELKLLSLAGNGWLVRRMRKATCLLGQGNLWRCQETLFGLHTKPAVYGARWLTARVCHTVQECAEGLSLAACAQCVRQAPARPSHQSTGLGLISPAESPGAEPGWSKVQLPGCATRLAAWCKDTYSVPEPAPLPWALPVVAVVSGCGGFAMAFCMNGTPKCLLKQGPNHYEANCF